MSIGCGNCGSLHDTVDEIRACHLHNAGASLPQASDKQKAYIRMLLEERVLPESPPAVVERAKVDPQFQINIRDASDLIEILTGFEKKPKQRGPVESAVPEGKYAIKWTNILEPYIEFYQVDKPDEGRWKGYTFVKRLIGAPGNFRQEPVRGPAATEVLRSIVRAGTEESSKLFGQEIGVCGICSSPLTNDESRTYGIGPICRVKMESQW
jgi:hypothetical protein